VTLAERRERKGDLMRGRLAAALTVAVLMVPVAAASAGASGPPKPGDPKCPASADRLHNHCDDATM
jgi:hypothetical protein